MLCEIIISKTKLVFNVLGSLGLSPVWGSLIFSWLLFLCRNSFECPRSQVIPFTFHPLPWFSLPLEPFPLLRLNFVSHPCVHSFSPSSWMMHPLSYFIFLQIRNRNPSGPLPSLFPFAFACGCGSSFEVLSPSAIHFSSLLSTSNIFEYANLFAVIYMWKYFSFFYDAICNLYVHCGFACAFVCVHSQSESAMHECQVEIWLLS